MLTRGSLIFYSLENDDMTANIKTIKKIRKHLLDHYTSDTFGGISYLDKSREVQKAHLNPASDPYQSLVTNKDGKKFQSRRVLTWPKWERSAYAAEPESKIYYAGDFSKGRCFFVLDIDNKQAKSAPNDSDLDAARAFGEKVFGVSGSKLFVQPSPGNKGIYVFLQVQTKAYGYDSVCKAYKDVESRGAQHAHMLPDGFEFDLCGGRPGNRRIKNKDFDEELAAEISDTPRYILRAVELKPSHLRHFRKGQIHTIVDTERKVAKLADWRKVFPGRTPEILADITVIETRTNEEKLSEGDRFYKVNNKAAKYTNEGPCRRFLIQNANLIGCPTHGYLDGVRKDRSLYFLAWLEDDSNLVPFRTLRDNLAVKEEPAPAPKPKPKAEPTTLPLKAIDPGNIPANKAKVFDKIRTRCKHHNTLVNAAQDHEARYIAAAAIALQHCKDPQDALRLALYLVEQPGGPATGPRTKRRVEHLDHLIATQVAWRGTTTAKSNNPGFVDRINDPKTLGLQIKALKQADRGQFAAAKRKHKGITWDDYARVVQLVHHNILTDNTSAVPYASIANGLACIRKAAGSPKNATKSPVAVYIGLAIDSGHIEKVQEYNRGRNCRHYIISNAAVVMDWIRDLITTANVTGICNRAIKAILATAQNLSADLKQIQAQTIDSIASTMANYIPFWEALKHPEPVPIPLSSFEQMLAEVS